MKSVLAILVGGAVTAAVWTPTPVLAQDDGCAFLCAPELKIEPTITFEPIFRRPTIEALDDGRVVGRGQPDTDSVFELVLAIEIPTEIPRVGFTVETIFVPSGDAVMNPFTGAPAEELGAHRCEATRLKSRSSSTLDCWSPGKRAVGSGLTSISSTSSARLSGPATTVAIHTS